MEVRVEQFIIGDSCLTIAEALVSGEFGRLEGRDESIPELFERRQMDGEETVVGGAENIGLRESRSIAGTRRTAERKEGSERFDPEVRHGLQHGDLNMATFIGAAALHERTQNAVRRVDAGNGIGERATQESRT